MKKFRLAMIIIAAAFVGLAMTSCEPEEVDAFIDGFYDGYYGTYGEATPETQIEEQLLK